MRYFTYTDNPNEDGVLSETLRYQTSTSIWTIAFSNWEVVQGQLGWEELI